MILKATSILSNSSAQQIFQVLFLDQCRDLFLTDPIFSESFATIQLYEPAIFNVTLSSSDPPGCGVITYSLLNEFDNSQLSALDFTLFPDASKPYLEITGSNKDYLFQQYEIVVEASLDSKSATSEPLTVFFEDPCFNTELISRPIPSLFTIVDEENPVTYKVPIFQDTVSVTYSQEFGNGQGTDLCGPQFATLFERVNGQLQVVDFAYLTQDGD